MTSATVTEVLLTGESMMSFAPNLMKEERDDLFDLLMQADGFASRAFDRQQLWKSWMDRYRNRLEKHGCRPVSLITEPAQVDFDFWTSTRRDMVLRVVGGVYRFDRQVYDGYRQAIRADLRERALAQVVRIELER